MYSTSAAGSTELWVNLLFCFCYHLAYNMLNYPPPVIFILYYYMYTHFYTVLRLTCPLYCIVPSEDVTDPEKIWRNPSVQFHSGSVTQHKQTS